jgi:hypothetical protein
MAPVKITQKTYEGLEDLRKSGAVRLTDLASTIKELDERGHYEASDWVQLNRELYEQGLREGFQIED